MFTRRSERGIHAVNIFWHRYRLYLYRIAAWCIRVGTQSKIFLWDIIRCWTRKKKKKYHSFIICSSIVWRIQFCFRICKINYQFWNRDLAIKMCICASSDFSVYSVKKNMHELPGLLISALRPAPRRRPVVGFVCTVASVSYVYFNNNNICNRVHNRNALVRFDLEKVRASRSKPKPSRRGLRQRRCGRGWPGRPPNIGYKNSDRVRTSVVHYYNDPRVRRKYQT